MTRQTNVFKVKRQALALVLFLVLATSPAVSQTVILAWQPSPDTNAAGYNIYYGTASHVYTTKVSVGNVTNAMIYGLTGGQTYFFSATTYDVLNQESGFSNEASYAVPLNVTNAQPTLAVLSDLVINENAPAQSIPLTGISSGTTNENQTLTVTASSSNLALIPNPTVTYTSPNTTGSIAFTPVSNAFGAATISVTVNDGGTSNNIITRTFNVTVNHVNQTPTLNVLSNVAISENAPAQTIALTGISSGATNENQSLTVTASSSKPGLIPNPTVTYSSPSSSGSITFTPVAKNFGAAVISVTVNDGGTSNNIITRTFNVTVNNVNQPPTLNVLSNVVFNENAPIQTIALTGISSGATNENQTLTVTASSSNLALIPNPTVTYTSPNTTGSIAFTPVSNAFGAATISVTVNDGGTSNNIITRTFNVTVNHVNQTPTLNVLSNVAISENAPAQTIALTGISSGATNENQSLTVTASSSKPGLIPNPTVTYSSPSSSGSITFTPVAKNFGAAVISVTVNDGGTSNNIITRTFNVTVNNVNQPPTLNVLSNVVFNENAPIQTIALTGISSGATNENQTLTVTASSSNLALIPNPTVTYISPNTAGSISFTPVSNAFGAATISVTVNDGGNNNNIITRTFNVTVNNVNQPPTLNAFSNVVISENAPVQTVALTGISSGATNENQTLTVTASSSKPGLIPIPTVTYTSPNTTGSLIFMPMTNAFGVATISVTVNDGGTSNNIITRHFSVTVLGSDLTKPTLRIVSPSANERRNSGTCTVNGKANDSVAISQLLCSLNGAPWTSAITFNNWKDWTCSLSLKPGNNTLRAYAVDTSGNISPTSTVTFSYDLLMPLSIQTFGLGTSNPRWGSIRPNNSGRMLLPVNENSTLTAKASPGFAFANWTDGSGNLLTNSATLQFTMATNLTLRANFVDVTRPTLSIMTPSANQQVTNGAFTVAGLAGDNQAVSTVYFSLNGSGWTPAWTGNNWRNWTASLALVPGTNNVRAYAVDNSGNFSTINSVEFKYMITGQLSAALAVQQTAPPALARAVAPAKGLFALTVSGTAGYNYVVQVSSDLMNWTSVLTNKAPFMFVDTNANRFQQRFYRSFYQP